VSIGDRLFFDVVPNDVGFLTEHFQELVLEDTDNTGVQGSGSLMSSVEATVGYEEMSKGCW
jgi:hypothetical protein